MTMHLEGPWLSTTGRKRGPRKWASADAKKLAQQRQADWDRKLIQFEQLTPKFSTGPYNAPKKTMKDFMPKTPLVEKLHILLAAIQAGFLALKFKIRNILALR